ncbi:hypothetical protein C8Q80DRAFT_1190622 [Daedaleopsis nitida]|nr:hypothetical protein C8Q80DRAFT_1190622 [Daedaleopsis nitida]
MDLDEIRAEQLTLAQRLKLAFEYNFPFDHGGDWATLEATKTLSNAEKVFCQLRQVVHADLIVRPTATEEAHILNCVYPKADTLTLHNRSRTLITEGDVAIMFNKLCAELYLPHFPPIGLHHPFKHWIHSVTSVPPGLRLGITPNKNFKSESFMACDPRDMDCRKFSGTLERQVNGLKTQPKFQPAHDALKGSINSTILEIKTDEVLLAHIAEIEKLRAKRTYITNYEDTNGGEDMCIQVAYAMWATFCRHGALLSTSYGYLCRLRERDNGAVLELDGPFHLREPTPVAKQKLDDIIGAEAKVLTYTEAFMFFYRAQQETVDYLSGWSMAKNCAARASGRAITGALRWLAAVAFRSCNAIMVHNTRGDPPTHMERTAPSLVAPGRFDPLVALFCPRTLHVYPIAMAGEGVTSHVMQVSFGGLLSCVLKSQHPWPEEEQVGATLKEEYNFVRQVKMRNPVRFAVLPIPHYHGRFSTVSNGAGRRPGEEGFQGMTDFLAMSDNGDPITNPDTQRILADERDRALALVRESGFPANDHDNFHNMLYDGKSLTIIDLV